ncbi:hypothetical protein BJV74DRAFT_558344 [Russula compacta]|nr:hypothetical protein BJV74DRAFT_558344 [Russula compacta]
MVIIEVDCFRRLEAGNPLPDDELVAKGLNAAQIHAARMAQLAEDRSASGFGTCFPNDHLASIQPHEDYNSVSDSDLYVRRLSTITERTEKTEFTEVPARSSASVAFSNCRSARAPSSATESSYGELIESHVGRTNFPVDPNTIRPSPPPSALQPSYDGSEVLDSDDGGSTRTVTPPPRRPSAPVPPPETSLDITDKSTRSSSSKPHPVKTVQVFKSSPPKGLFSPVDKPLPELPPPSEPRHSLTESRTPSDHPRKSKLSALASSRAASSKASSISQSSRLSSSTLATSSVRTYPVLRPSSESELSLIEVDEDSTAMSSIVRRAIRTALNKEAADRSAMSPPKQDREVQHDSTVESSSSSKSTPKPTSDAKDGTLTMFYTAAETSAASSGERPTSKLAKLAQAKSKQGGSGGPKPRAARSPSPSTLLGSSHTEYLTPIANGPTATTAITTSYQSLGSLLSPSRSASTPSVLPAAYSSASVSSEARPSKLAMKAKKSHSKRSSTEGDQDYLPVPVHAMFKPEGNRSHKGHRKERRDKLSRERRPRHGRTSPLDEPTANVKAPPSPKHKSSTVAAKAANMPLGPLGPFAFDIPSPDDIVFNARHGTSLARSSSDASTITALPASTAHSRSSFTSVSRVSTSAN